MHFLLYCTDKPDSVGLRQANREAHLAHVADSKLPIKVGGPYLDEDGTMIGSLIIVEADSKAEVEEWAASDPYAKAGLFANVDIHPFNWLINSPA